MRNFVVTSPGTVPQGKKASWRAIFCFWRSGRVFEYTILSGAGTLWFPAFWLSIMEDYYGEDQLVVLPSHDPELQNRVGQPAIR